MPSDSRLQRSARGRGLNLLRILGRYRACVRDPLIHGPALPIVNRSPASAQIRNLRDAEEDLRDLRSRNSGLPRGRRPEGAGEPGRQGRSARGARTDTVEGAGERGDVSIAPLIRLHPGGKHAGCYLSPGGRCGRVSDGPRRRSGHSVRRPDGRRKPFPVSACNDRTDVRANPCADSRGDPAAAGRGDPSGDSDPDCSADP